MSQRKGRPPIDESGLKMITGVSLSPELRAAARKRASELGLEGNLSHYLRNLIKQEVLLRDYYERMQKLYEKTDNKGT